MSLLPEHEDDVGEELSRVEELIRDAAGHRRITAWEEEFLASLAERIEQYGAHTRISPKQWAVLERIEEKLYR